MGLHRGIDGQVAGAEADRRPARAGTIASGTLACPDCDAPVGLAGARRPHDDLSCPFCGCAGAVRDFLSLAVPTRPARVEIRLVLSPA